MLTPGRADSAESGLADAAALTDLVTRAILGPDSDRAVGRNYV
jgi:hypothetical protein